MKIYIAVMICRTILMLEGKPSEPFAFYLYTQKKNWNEASYKCSEDNRRLVILKDSTKYNILLDITTKWISQGINVWNFWMGLFHTKGDFMWTDCMPLTNWSMWHPVEPDNIAVSKCIRMQFTNFVWRTGYCFLPLQYVCEISLDTCWYDTYQTTHLSTINQDIVSVGITSLAACENQCLTKDVPDVECVAFSFTGNNECLLLMKDKPYLDSEDVPLTEFKLSSVSGVKRCFLYYTTNNGTTYVNSGISPNFNCEVPPTLPAPVVSSQSTLIQPSSTWSFSLSASLPQATSPAPVVSSQSTLIQPSSTWSSSPSASLSQATTAPVLSSQSTLIQPSSTWSSSPSTSLSEATSPAPVLFSQSTLIQPSSTLSSSPSASLSQATTTSSVLSYQSMLLQPSSTLSSSPSASLSQATSTASVLSSPSTLIQPSSTLSSSPSASLSQATSTASVLSYQSTLVSPSSTWSSSPSASLSQATSPAPVLSYQSTLLQPSSTGSASLSQATSTASVQSYQSTLIQPFRTLSYSTSASFSQATSPRSLVSLDTMTKSTPSKNCSDCVCKAASEVVIDSTTGYTRALTLNKTSLSSRRRKFTSAEDLRTSATVIGAIGCLNIALFCLVFVLLDFTNLEQLTKDISQRGLRR